MSDAIITEVPFCGCTNTQLEQGKTCGQPECPNKTPDLIRYRGFAIVPDGDSFEVVNLITPGVPGGVPVGGAPDEQEARNLIDDILEDDDA